MTSQQTSFPLTSLAPIGENRPGAEWWRTAVIYQIYPRSFADASGDGIGDLPGVTAHLDDLRSLGVDAVWLSPFYRSPQHDAGYDVADYRDVDPRLGTLADFDQLMARATELGLRVIVDLVPNQARERKIRAVLNNSFGFGGTNASLAMKLV